MNVCEMSDRATASAWGDGRRFDVSGIYLWSTRTTSGLADLLVVEFGVLNSLCTQSGRKTIEQSRSDGALSIVNSLL
jgi:hypothetical protein